MLYFILGLTVSLSVTLFACRMFYKSRRTFIVFYRHESLGNTFSKTYNIGEPIHEFKGYFIYNIIES